MYEGSSELADKYDAHWHAEYDVEIWVHIPKQELKDFLKERFG